MSELEHTLSKYAIAPILCFLALVCISCSSRSAGTAWTTVDGKVLNDGTPEYFVGTNLWYAGRLAADEGGRERLNRELDALKSLGITNLRVLATEGEDIDCLEYALDRMQERGMSAVLFLNNAWEWSYGFAGYLEAAGAGAQPKPSVDGYTAYMEAMAAFSTNEEAIKLNHKYIRKTVSALKGHPAIFSWQICNEPRCFSNDPQVRDAFIKYIHSTAALIKSIDHLHMVSTGNEGAMGCEGDLSLYESINTCEDIDYITIHIWPYNWSWVKEDSVNDGISAAVGRTSAYIDEHLELAERLGKPLVIEEFGYPRDGFSFERSSTTYGRDRIYDCVFSKVIESAIEGGKVAGCNFWGWGGFAEPAHEKWQEGDDLCGDPAQEAQGLNSVFASDSSTIAVITAATRRLAMISTLKAASETGTPLYGHQDDLMYGHTWNVTKENDHTMLRSDVLSTAGAYPYILGLDLGGLETDSPVNLDGNDFGLMREAAIKHYERGGIVTLSWHLRNPLTGGDSWDVSSDKVVESILPGGSKHEFFMGWLDRIATYIASLKDSQGHQVPVIFRPWHEHTGGWFWWGTGLCTAQEYNALWKMTYDYIVNERGIKGLIWAVSPNSMSSDFESWEERYPGDGYVDLVGLDCYCPTYLAQPESFESFHSDIRNCLASLQGFSERHGKMLALTETGYEGLTYDKWWTEVLEPAIDGFPISFLLVWRNTDEMPRGMTHFYTPWPGGPSEEDFKDFVDRGKIKLLE